MSKPEEEPAEFKLKPFLIELAVYAVLVVAYFLLVLHFLGHWLKGLFDSHRMGYAVAALTIMIAQAVGLEAVTSALLRLIRSKTD